MSDSLGVAIGIDDRPANSLVLAGDKFRYADTAGRDLRRFGEWQIVPFSLYLVHGGSSMSE